MEHKCPFCDLSNCEIVAKSNSSTAFFDKFPVTEGHTLIVPNRHVSNYFDLTDIEKNDIWEMVERSKSVLDKLYGPDGYNVGINCGEAAGQTIPHVHVHLIPRYKGDIENPKGGVRGVIPAKQKY